MTFVFLFLTYFSFCILGSSFIHLIRTDSGIFLFTSEWYSIVYMYSFFIHSSVSGHPGSFNVLAIVNSAAVNIGVVVVESLSHVRLFVTTWTVPHQGSLSFTISWNLLKCMSIELVKLFISSSAALFSFCLQSFPALGFFPISRLFSPGDQSITASASVLPIGIQGWFPLRLTGLISLLSNHYDLVIPLVGIYP